ncbi:MAG: anthranilate phosphoribosyltransferase [Acidobacteriota bacterium]
MSLLPYLHRAAAREDLSAEDARLAMNVLLDGAATPVEIAAFLTALRTKGETALELAGFARAMRAHMISVDAGVDLVDNCGTGGDGSGTFNISTTAAFVMAGAGAIVAKHGNRSISSATGAADVLEALGIRVTVSPQEAASSLREIGIAFLFAPAFHPAIKHVQPVRRELKMRTVFNLLGPLANPARVQMQVIGAPSVAAAGLIADALCELTTKRVFVVHGHSGLDEISTTGPTDVFEVCAAKLKRHVWEPADFGLQPAQLGALAGGDAEHNARIVRAILSGEQGAPREIVLANAAAGLVAAGLAENLLDGVRMAAESIDSGAARDKLSALQSYLLKP